MQRERKVSTLSFKRARCRWQMAYTLLNNPSLQLIRKKSFSMNQKPVINKLCQSSFTTLGDYVLNFSINKKDAT